MVGEKIELNLYDQELFHFLSNLKITRFLSERRAGGPVQYSSSKSTAFQEGLTIIYPLPWPTFSGKNLNRIAICIMDQVEKWAMARHLERFGCIVPGDCPLLLKGEIHGFF